MFILPFACYNSLEALHGFFGFDFGIFNISNWVSGETTAQEIGLSPYFLYCWFCNFWAVFDHFPQITPHPLTSWPLMGKPVFQNKLLYKVNKYLLYRQNSPSVWFCSAGKYITWIFCTICQYILQIALWF